MPNPDPCDVIIGRGDPQWRRYYHAAGERVGNAYAPDADYFDAVMHDEAISLANALFWPLVDGESSVWAGALYHLLKRSLAGATYR